MMSLGACVRACLCGSHVRFAPKANIRRATREARYGPIADISAVVRRFLAPVTPARLRLSRQTLWENPSAWGVRPA